MQYYDLTTIALITGFTACSKSILIKTLTNHLTTIVLMMTSIKFAFFDCYQYHQHINKTY